MSIALDEYTLNKLEPLAPEALKLHEPIAASAYSAKCIETLTLRINP